LPRQFQSDTFGLPIRSQMLQPLLQNDAHDAMGGISLW
jgi:hypothetical protein